MLTQFIYINVKNYNFYKSIMKVQSLKNQQKLVPLQKQTILQNSNKKNVKEENHNICTDLVGINFFPEGYLCTTGYRANIFPQMTKFIILNAIKLISLKQNKFIDLEYQDQQNQLPQDNKLDQKQKERAKISKHQAVKNSVDLIKPLPNIGESVYIYFYFTGQYFFYDHLRNQLILSKQNKSQFKIVLCEQASFDKNQKIIHAGFVKHKHQFSSQIKFNKFQYQILLADNPSLVLRQSDNHQIQLSFKHDQFTKLSFHSHYFHPNNSLGKFTHGRPFRLFHLGYEKYLSYYQKSKNIKVQEYSPVLKGVFCLQKVKNSKKKNKILVLGQGSSNDYLCHGAELNIQKSSSLDNYLKQSLSLSSMNQFLKGQIKSNIINSSKKVVSQSISVVKKSQKQIDLKSLINNSLISQVQGDVKFEFMVQLYREQEEQLQQNILIQCQSTTISQKTLNLKQNNQKAFIMDEFSFNQDSIQSLSTNQSTQANLNNLQNVLRVQYIRNQMLLPFTFYLFLQSKTKFLTIQSINADVICKINQILKDFIYLILTDNNINFKLVTHQLIQLNVLSIFQKILQLCLNFYMLAEIQDNKKIIQEYVKNAVRIVQLFCSVYPQALFIGFISTNQKLLLSKMCISRKFLHLIKNIQLKNVQNPQQIIDNCVSLLQKLQLLQQEDFSIYKMMTQRSQNIEQNLQSLKKNVKYCIIIHAVKILSTYQLQNKYFQKLVNEILAKSENKLNQQLVSAIQVVKIIRGNYYFNSRLMNKFYLSEVMKEDIFLTVKLQYLSYFLKSDAYNQFSIRIYFQDQQANAFISKKNSLQQNQNSTFTKNMQSCESIIQNVIPKNCRFQQYDNKIMSFKICNFLSLCQVQALQIVPPLISGVIQSFKSYTYSQKQKYLFVCEGINTLSYLINYYFQEFTLECFKNQQSLPFKQIVTKNCGLLINKIINRGGSSKPINQGKIQVQILTDISQLTWEYLNIKFQPYQMQTQNQISCFYKFLHILINMACPSRKFFYLLKQSNYIFENEYSKQFLRVLKHFKQMTYKYKIISFSEMLISFLENSSSTQCASIINLIQKNKLMKYFIFSQNYCSQEKSQNRQVKYCYKVIMFLMEHTKQNFDEYQFSKVLSKYITYNMVYAYNQISVPRVMNLLLKKFQLLKRNNKTRSMFHYYQQDICMYITILKQLGQICSESIYSFFISFILNLSIQKYSLNFIKYLLVFFNSLTPLLANDFLSRYQRFFIDNIQSFQKLMSNIGFAKNNKELSQQNIQFYTLLFFMLQTFSVNKDKIKNGIGIHVRAEYPYFILSNKNIPMNFKIILIKFAITNIQMKNPKQQTLLQQLYEEDLNIIQLKIFWAKQASPFVQIQIEVLKQFKKQPNFKQIIKNTPYYISYVETLIQLIKSRQELLDIYLKIDSQLKSSMISNPKQVINSNQILSYRGINKLLALEMIQLIQKVLEQENPNSKLYYLIVWFQSIYKINLSNLSTNLRSPIEAPKQVLQFNYCISLLDIEQVKHQILKAEGIKKQKMVQQSIQSETEQKLDQQLKLYFFDFPKIHEQLNQRLESYIVILIQVLKRLIIAVYGTKDQQNLCFQKEYEIFIVLKHIQYGAQQIYMRFKQLQKNNVEVQGKNLSNYQKQILKIFQVIFLLQKYKKFKYISLVHSILNYLIESNENIHALVQTLVLKNKTIYYKIITEIIERYKLFSPFIKNQNQIYQFKIDYALIDQVLYSNFSSETDWKQAEQQLNWIAFQFFKLMQFLTNLSTSLNFQFKSFFNQQKVGQKSIIFFMIQIIELSIKNLSLKCSSKLQFLALQMKFINVLMHGPMKDNIKLSSQCKYDRKILSLIRLNQKQFQKTLPNVIAIKKITFQSFSLMNPYMRIDQNFISSTQTEMARAYINLKNDHSGNLDNIVQEVIRNKLSENQNIFLKSFLYFQLGLSIFFCLTKMYQRNKITTIKELQNKKIHDRLLTKKYMKNLKIFYQLYLIVKQLFVWILGKCINFGKEKIEELQSEDSQQKLYLKRSLVFYVKNTSNIQLKINQNLQRIQFLLLKQSVCQISSIRKEMYRQIGVRKRPERLYKFMNTSKYIILRLQVEKRNKNFIERYKPLQIIIKNRQLWKSLNFGTAIMLNILFVYNPLISNDFDNYSTAIFRAIGYLLCLFLFIIYFFQSVPLKVAMILQQKKINKKISFKALIGIFADKTLWFASIYFVIISISILWEHGMVAVLMVDFFVRFKISRQVTQIITRPFIQLILITLALFSFLFVFTTSSYYFGKQGSCNSIANCLQGNFMIFYGINKNVFTPVQFGGVLSILSIYFRYVCLVINLSIIVGILIYQKNKKDQDARLQVKLTKNTCFICDFDRSDVERLRANITGFRDHIQAQHYVWNYIYYIIYLKNKHLKDLNVVEETIFKLWKQDDWSWLPDCPSPNEKK